MLRTIALWRACFRRFIFLLLDPAKQDRFARTDCGAQAEMRKALSLHEIVHLPAKRGVSIEKRGDTVGAMQDVAADRGLCVSERRVNHS